MIHFYQDPIPISLQRKDTRTIDIYHERGSTRQSTVSPIPAYQSIDTSKNFNSQPYTKRKRGGGYSSLSWQKDIIEQSVSNDNMGLSCLYVICKI